MSDALNCNMNSKGGWKMPHVRREEETNTSFLADYTQKGVWGRGCEETDINEEKSLLAE